MLVGVIEWSEKPFRAFIHYLLLALRPLEMRSKCFIQHVADARNSAQIKILILHFGRIFIEILRSIPREEFYCKSCEKYFKQPWERRKKQQKLFFSRWQKWFFTLAKYFAQILFYSLKLWLSRLYYAWAFRRRRERRTVKSKQRIMHNKLYLFSESTSTN